MSNKIRVTHNLPRIAALMAGLSNQRELQKTVARSIRRTLPSVQKAAFQQIKSKKFFRVKSSEMKIKARAYIGGTASTSIEEQYGKIWITPKAESLGHFFPKRIAAGRSTRIFGQDKYGAWNGVRLYRVQLNKYGAPYIRDPQRTFMVNKKGGPVVFARLGSVKRLPIAKLFGPSPADLFRDNGVMPVLEAVARARYQTEFMANAKFYVDQAVRKALAKK